MTTRQSIAVVEVIPQYRYSEGLGRRRLLTPDEVLRLPNDQVLIIIRGQKILRAKKFDYTSHPYAKEMSKTSIQDFIPCRGTESPKAQALPTEEKPPAAVSSDDKVSATLPPDPLVPEPPAPKPKPARRRPTLYESAKPPDDF